MAWSSNRNDFKTIYIAGNEPFTQGPVHYSSAAELARGMGVVVNTIHCGSYDDGVAGRWQDGARLAGGAYLNIDQDRSLPPIIAPQDERLMQLNVELNNTYVWYGREGRAAAERQKVQDDNAAAAAPQAMSQRIATKANGLYRQADKDLVDAMAEPMRAMNEDQRREYVAEQAARRAQIQEQINALSAERAKHVAQVRAQQAEAGQATLGDAILATVTEQIEAAGYEVSAPAE